MLRKPTYAHIYDDAIPIRCGQRPLIVMALVNSTGSTTDSFELQEVRAARKPFLATDSQNDAVSANEREEVGRTSVSSDSTVQDFELYTPDEEKVVLRKMDTHVVLFMSFLYLLSFLDRSSEDIPICHGLSSLV